VTFLTGIHTRKVILECSTWHVNGQSYL